jgi:hypothetical protein
MDANIHEAIQSQVHSTVSASQDLLLNSVTTLLDTRLDGFQRKIQETQKTMSENQLVQIDETMTDTYTFRKICIDEQPKHSQKVFVEMREVNAEIIGENLSIANINNAKRKITEGMDLIRNRQKLIKLADSSDTGWRVVDEYVANLLAEDTDDKRKMYKAQSRAVNKLKREKMKRRTERRATPYRKPVATEGNAIPVNVAGSSVKPGDVSIVMRTVIG